MLSDNLIEKVLLDPSRDGADCLFIVSGYASATMATRHLYLLDKEKHEVQINLIVGMCPVDGLTTQTHNGLVKLASELYPTRFNCHYLKEPPAVHAKLYSWYKSERPSIGFLGSANYTQTGFSKNQKEALEITDAAQLRKYYDDALKLSIDCRDSEVRNVIQIKDEDYVRFAKMLSETREDTLQSDTEYEISKLQHYRLSLLTKDGGIQNQGGLNWGQREVRKRKSEAYIQLRSDIYKTDFFPPKTVHFTIITDDGFSFICTRAEKRYGETIHTPFDNTQLGLYFRRRISVADDAFVQPTDLSKYGRTDLDFYKIDDETFLMDFSVRK